MKNRSESEAQLEDIKTFISFAVEQSQVDAAYKFVEQYRDDQLALRLFYEHYSALPDAIEEAVCKVYELNTRHGVHCLLLKSETAFFIYLISVDEVLYAGNRVDDFSDDLILFIDQGDKSALAKKLEKLENIPEYTPSDNRDASLCPVCGVAEGEYHILGCMAEVCPWCDGQLGNCNCRFEKMDLEEFKTEKQLEAFEKLLDEQGRVPFTKDQKISYPGMSKGLDRGENN